MRITVFFTNASAKCCAPLSPILLHMRSNVVSTCVKKWICVHGRNVERMRITVFFANASARCCPPTAPI